MLNADELVVMLEDLEAVPSLVRRGDVLLAFSAAAAAATATAAPAATLHTCVAAADIDSLTCPHVFPFIPSIHSIDFCL